jgi:SH3-like domain-containing protein
MSPTHRAVAAILIAGAMFAAPVRAADGDEHFPRFASFKSGETYMREGPSKETRVKWIYHRKGLPVEVLAKYDVWRRVRDSDGEIGWVHVAMLSTDRMALVIGPDNAVARQEERYGAPVAAEVQPGAIGELKSCGRLACRIVFGDIEGWIDRSRLYGVYVDEVF